MTVRRVIGLLAALTFLLAACGDSDPVVSQDSSDGSSSSVGDSSDNSDTGSVELPDGTDVEFGFDAENCEQLTAAFENDPFNDSLLNGDDPTEGLQAAAAYLESIVDDVPDEISADVQVLADAYKRLATASADIDWDAIASGDPTAAIEASQLATAFGDGSFLEAASNLAAFTAENCAGAPG